MVSNHFNWLVIFLDILLITSFVLVGFADTRSNSRHDQRNFTLSSAQDCARECQKGEPPRICYYKFTLELYPILGGACALCTPNDTNTLWSNCQCIPADGVERIIMAVNRMLPGPSIQLCKNDKVVIDVVNHIDGTEVSIHWHGLFQSKSPYFDGVPFLTQCPISHGSTFRYQFIAENEGTHFWHAHTGLQKMDGIHGSFIVRVPLCEDPNSKLYDHDMKTHVMIVVDWMHEQTTERYPGRRINRPGQSPDSFLINGKGQYRDPTTGILTNTTLQVFTVKRGYKYRFRMVNSFCATCGGELKIQGHNLTVISVDGVPVIPRNVTTITTYAGERVDFVINANQHTGAYWIHLRGLGECANNQIQQWAILQYEGESNQPQSERPTYAVGLPQGVVLGPVDGICNVARPGAICFNQLKSVHPIEKGILKRKADMKLYLPIGFHLYTPQQLYQPNTYNRYFVIPNGLPLIAMLDNIAFENPPSPPLSQIKDIPPGTFCNRNNLPDDCKVPPCSCTHMIDIPYDTILELITYDQGPPGVLNHPFHMHGYAYHLMGMGSSPITNGTLLTPENIRELDKNGQLYRNFDQPPLKDTVAVPSGGYAIFRIRANNPGYWLLHCHFVFHSITGMDIILHVGNITDLSPVPPKFPTCGNYLPPIAAAKYRSYD